MAYDYDTENMHKKKNLQNERDFKWRLNYTKVERVYACTFVSLA